MFGRSDRYTLGRRPTLSVSDRPLTDLRLWVLGGWEDTCLSALLVHKLCQQPSAWCWSGLGRVPRQPRTWKGEKKTKNDNNKQ